MRFEWDDQKNAANQAKDGITFEEASTLFEFDEDYLEIFDTEHSVDEDRFICIGIIARGVVLVVTTEPADDCIRIVSARWATRTEEDLFAKYMKGRIDD